MRFQKARRVTPHRKRPVIFVGCEGDAEDEYFVWLQQFLNQLQLPVHFQPINLHGGGILKLTARGIEEASRKAR